jgi:hypothetical protein
MGASVYKVNGTGAVAIATSLTVPADQTYELVSVTCAFNVASATSENFTITLNANAGAAYDVLLYTVDPSVASLTSLLWQPDEPVLLEAGDAIDVAYANSDARTYGLQITARGAG